MGLTALTSSILYFVSDVIEWRQGGFSDGQLWLTLVAEATIPVFVVGLYCVQRSNLGRLGAVSAAAYAYSYAFFTGTVVYALVNHTKNWDALTHDLGPAMTLHWGSLRRGRRGSRIRGEQSKAATEMDRHRPDRRRSPHSDIADPARGRPAHRGRDP
jgi:hypothetical protein